MSHRNKDTLARRASEGLHLQLFLCCSPSLARFEVAHFLVGWPQSPRNAAELKPEALAKAMRLNGPSLALQASSQALFRHISLKCATSKSVSEGRNIHPRLRVECAIFNRWQ